MLGGYMCHTELIQHGAAVDQRAETRLVVQSSVLLVFELAAVRAAGPSDKLIHTQQNCSFTRLLLLKLQPWCQSNAPETHSHWTNPLHRASHLLSFHKISCWEAEPRGLISSCMPYDWLDSSCTICCNSAKPNLPNAEKACYLLIQSSLDESGRCVFHAASRWRLAAHSWVCVGRHTAQSQLLWLLQDAISLHFTARRAPSPACLRSAEVLRANATHWALCFKRCHALHYENKGSGIKTK